MPVIPDRDEKPTAEQPIAQKEEKEEASPEQPQQPQSARKIDRPVKVNRGEDLPANAPSPEELAKNWNEAANKTGNAEYGYPIVEDDVTPADFTPAVHPPPTAVSAPLPAFLFCAGWQSLSRRSVG